MSRSELEHTDVGSSVPIPGGPATAHDSMADRLVAIYDRFRTAATLEPSDEISRLFTELMQLCLDRPGVAADELLADPRIRAIVPGLREICARAEYVRELSWAKRMLADGDPAGQLSAVPFAENYRQLVRFEIHAIRGAGHADPRSILMVGSGPLPFTAMLYADTLSARADSLDIDAAACECASGLYRAFNVGAGSRVHQGDILRFTTLDCYDLVILGASVGFARADRLRAIGHLAEHMRPGAILLLRTAHGMRTLLFPQVDAADLDGFVPQLLVRPFSRVINSVLVAYKPIEPRSA